jgi:GT2 family glycosyltransferase
MSSSGPAPEAAPVDVSVSIVNHVNRDLLLACLASLADDPGRRASVEVVVLDNASGDGSVEAVQERFPDVRVIAQPFRGGFGANHNAIIRATDSRHVLVLNEDTVVEPGTIDRLVDELDAHPRAGAVAPRIVFPDGRRQPSAWRFPDPLGCAVAAFTLGQASVDQSAAESPRTVDWATGCALLLRRAALDQVGTFDEGFFMYVEETDLCRRLGDRGWEIRLLPDVRVQHHLKQASSGEPDRRVREIWRSRRRYWAKHHSRPGARLARALLALQYAGLTLAARVLPGRVGVSARELRLHLACALRPVEGPGLRESAEDWNARHAAPTG